MVASFYTVFHLFHARSVILSRSPSAPELRDADDSATLCASGMAAQAKARGSGGKSRRASNIATPIPH